jgi:hypothetical protein
MPFVQFTKEQVAARGRDALSLQLPFDELALLSDNSAYIKKALEVNELVLVRLEDVTENVQSIAETAAPGQPHVTYA